MAMQCIYVALGGALGAVGRYLMGFVTFLPKSFFPAATLLVNLIGAVLIGMIAQIAAQKGLENSGAVLFLKVGVCGGFTTFSSFSLEAVSLFSAGKTALGAAYIALSVVLCLLGVLLGQWLGQKLA